MANILLDYIASGTFFLNISKKNGSLEVAAVVALESLRGTIPGRS
jgi:hypothetical protein